jgi:integrase
VNLVLVQPDALVFGNREGAFRHPETFSKLFVKAVARCRRDLGDDAVPAIRLHDLRHTHATLLLSAREPVKVVSERLGHASAIVTMTVYAHVLPGSQRQAAEGFAALVAGASK